MVLVITKRKIITAPHVAILSSMIYISASDKHNKRIVQQRQKPNRRMINWATCLHDLQTDNVDSIRINFLHPFRSIIRTAINSVTRSRPIFSSSGLQCVLTSNVYRRHRAIGPICSSTRNKSRNFESSGVEAETFRVR